MNLNERITAVYFLQRFVRMSQSLLPAFHELIVKKNPTPEEEEEMNAIIDIYDSFNVDPQISMVLINSPIVQLILDVYTSVRQKKGTSPEAEYTYNSFCKETDRLILTWEKQLLN